MNLSVNWLKQYIDLTDITTAELAEMITKSGVEVEQIHPKILDDDKIVVGYVKTCEQHPNADKLSLCQVDVGDEVLQIVCGAPNVKEGQYVVVAKPGAKLPGNFKIKKTKLRGEASEGMICSLDELGFDEKYIHDDYKDGIFYFQEEVSIGEPACPLLNLNDEIIELDVTANRSDCLSYYGLAYEVAAIFNKEINLPNPEVFINHGHSKDYISVKIEDEEANPYYSAWVIKDVHIKPSPLWLQNRLISAGIRPINNVVDITNYILLEYGQPLHAFDYDRLGSKKIVTRPAKKGETIKTLDGVERKLAEDHLVITNGENAHAIAGVMGGEESEVRDDTTTIILEAAYFNPRTVRKTSKDHGLRSESSARFEKGIDMLRVKEAATRAAQLLSELANGKVLGEIVEAGETKWNPNAVTFTHNEINQKIGTTISVNEMKSIIERLRFDYEEKDGQFTVMPPSRRQDIEIKEDMEEEIARLYGYDHIPFTLPEGEFNRGGLNKNQQLVRKIHHYLQSAGLNETISYSLTTAEKSVAFVSPDVKQLNPKPVKLSMPMSDLHSHLRLSAIPEMLQSVQHNVARNQHNVSIYELGSVYINQEEEMSSLPKEQLRLSAAMTGLVLEHPWQGENKQVDFYTIKGILEGLLNYLEIDIELEQGELDGLHPGRTALIKLNDEAVGFIGQIHPNVQKDYDLNDTYIFDLNLEKVLNHYEQNDTYRKIPKYPAIQQDLAFVVDTKIKAKELEKAILKQGQPYLQSVHVFDIYEGEHMEDGKKSIAFHLLFQDENKTLTDDEVEKARGNIVTYLEETYEAVLRG